jgi:hypothetical protein
MCQAVFGGEILPGLTIISAHTATSAKPERSLIVLKD